MTALRASALAVDLGHRRVLHDVGFTVAPGELVGLIGPNGAGKTTLLRTLAGLAAPVSGTVTSNGDDLYALKPRQRAQRLAYLAQDRAVHWPLPVERLVSLGRVPHLAPFARPTPADAAAIERAMTACAVTGLRARSMASLSGGERARALLARALAADPSILLADEPVAGLDPYYQLQMMDLFAARAAAGLAVVVVLHDLALALRYCHRLYLMQQGRIVASGPPVEVLTSQRLAAVYGITASFGTVAGQPVVSLERAP